MPVLTLQDGAKRSFDDILDGHQLARAISPSLAKQALALKVDGEMRDLSFQLAHNAQVEIITAKQKEGLELLRHDAAHIMAQAVQELFEHTQVTIGPVIENGFYYDFAKEEPFTMADLQLIEDKMREIVDRDIPIQREVWKRDEAVKHFRDIGEDYKAQIIEAIPKGEEISVYRQGAWKDLCRGPHLTSTGRLGKAFKLMRVAGAYWRGDSNNPQLQRIYGTAWASEAQLNQYLTMLEEAAKRDHRVLGPRMNLFHFGDDAPGSLFWHPKGWQLLTTLSDYLRWRQKQAGYQEINTPDMMHLSLWEKSGHWEKFGEHMFTSQTEDKRIHALKPMNCPGHVETFKYGQKSYRDLPLRFSEFGKVHRYEPSGALHGMLRLRHFTQDDAHIFCTDAQVESECKNITDLLLDIYRQLGFEEVKIKFADKPEKYVGTDEIWTKAENALLNASKQAGIDCEYNQGEGAFYGPKLEFVLRDAIGRDWQCGTVQLDFNLPQRLGAYYIDKNGDKRHPVMIHRALFGSMERFAGILIENYEGWLPFWMCPQQIIIAPITNEFDDYAQKAALAFQNANLRAFCDLRSEKINYKVQDYSQSRAAILGAVGKRDLEAGNITLRWLKTGKMEVLKLEDAVRLLSQKNQLGGFQPHNF